jgi:hypothetical protein
VQIHALLKKGTERELKKGEEREGGMERSYLGRALDMVRVFNLSHFSMDHHRVQGPVLVFVSSCDLLLHSGDEALRIEESCDPERVRTSSLEPTLVLLVSHQQTPIPDPKIWGKPGELISSRAVVEVRVRGGGEGGEGRSLPVEP